jgi:cytochrome c oxidase assembly protein subunit 11
MKSNRRIVLNLVALAAGMFMLAYASVPLYRLFCAVTGYGGTTRQASHAPEKALDREITVFFNADTDPALPWHFAPLQRSVKVKVGQASLAHYEAKNNTDKAVLGRATYNVLPFKAGSYFVKVACFCFEEQTLAAGARVDMPVSFYIDPSIMDDPEMDDVQTITLSYTFFPLRK